MLCLNVNMRVNGGGMSKGVVIVGARIGEFPLLVWLRSITCDLGNLVGEGGSVLGASSMYADERTRLGSTSV